MSFRRPASIVAVLAVLSAAFASAASAASPPTATVNTALRRAEIADMKAFRDARLACSWSAGLLTYSCVIWAPSAVTTGTVVHGVNATVYRHRSIQACGKLWPAGSSAQGCREVTAKPSCRFSLSTYARSGGSATSVILNVCTQGWLKRL